VTITRGNPRDIFFQFSELFYKKYRYNLAQRTYTHL